MDCSVSRSLLTALLTALKANGELMLILSIFPDWLILSSLLALSIFISLSSSGSQGVFCEVQPTDGLRMEFLTKLGFLEILRGEARPREGVVLGRLL